MISCCRFEILGVSQGEALDFRKSFKDRGMYLWFFSQSFNETNFREIPLFQIFYLSRETKISKESRQHYWWCGINMDITNIKSHCLHCQQMKFKNFQLGGLTGMLHILKGKGEFDSIQVIINSMIKSNRFQLVQSSYSLERLAQIFHKEIVHYTGCQFPLFFILLLNSHLASRGIYERVGYQS